MGTALVEMMKGEGKLQLLYNNCSALLFRLCVLEAVAQIAKGTQEVLRSKSIMKKLVWVSALFYSFQSALKYIIFSDLNSF